MMALDEILKEQSDLAIGRGNEFEGFLGVAPADLTKEELIMVCNVLNSTIEELRFDILMLRNRLLL